MMATRPLLNELLKDIPKEKLNQSCQDVHLCELALSIPTWWTMAAFLGVTDVEVKEIEEEPGPPKKKKLSMLRKWKEKFGKRATYYEVANVLWKLGRTDLVEELCRIIQQSSVRNDGLPGTSQTMRPDDPSALKKYAEYLKRRYKNLRPTFLTNQWPPPPTLKVFHLAIIEKKPIQYSRVDEEHARLMLQGQVSDVLHSHHSTAVELENILETNTVKRTVVLIEGAPGSGKSTLAWHICQKWSLGKLFQEKEVIIFIELRNPAIQSANLLEDLLPADGRSKGELVRELQAVSGQNVLWVLDGWDEFPEPHTFSSYRSAVQQLIFHPEYFNLHCSSIIITSRPIATAVLQRHVSSRLQILGFTQTEVQQYIEDTLRNSELMKQLQEQLKERPVIEASCYLPLNAAIVAHLFLTQNHTLPNTLHGVFTSLVCCCLIRHVMKGSEEERKRLQSTPISSLENLPSELKQPFNNICILAFNGIIHNKATFSADDLISTGSTQEFQTLSLLQATECFSSFETSRTYNFLHLSIQELLAAFHISKLLPAVQARIFKTLYGQPRFAAVFCFYAAFTKLKTEGIRDIVKEIVLKETKTGRQHKPQLMYLLRILYETQDLSLNAFVVSLLNGRLNFSHNALSPVDCISVGYFLSSICSVASGQFKVFFANCSLDNYRIGLLMEQLAKTIISQTVATQTGADRNATVPVLDMNLGHNSIYGRGIRAISEVIGSSWIYKLNLYSFVEPLNRIQEGEDGFAHLSHALTRNDCSSLVELNLAHCCLMITHENGPNFCHMLKINKSLMALHLSGNEGVADVGVHYIAEGLKCNTTLKELHLQQCAVTANGAEKLSDALLVNLSLEILSVGDNCLSDRGVTSMAKNLIQNHTLKELHLFNCKFTEKGSKFLFSDCLRENRYLLVLNVTGNQILDTRTGAEYVAIALEQNQTLKKLGLNHCGLSDNAVPSLAAALEVNTTLKGLWLGSNPFTNAGLNDIGQSLKKNKGLQWLYLENMDPQLVTKEGIQQFILCFQENYHLKLLRIGVPFSGCDFGSEIEAVNHIRRENNVAALHYNYM